MVCFHPRALGWAESSSQEARQCVTMVTKQHSSLFSPTYMHRPPNRRPTPSSSRQTLLVSLQARRGVRVGSICLGDGHRCQSPQGPRGEEGRLVWSRTVTDASELSPGWHGTERWNRGYRECEAERDRVTRVRRAGDEDGGIRSGLEIALKPHIHSGKDKKC